MTDKFMVFVPGNVPEGPHDAQDLAQRLKSGILPGTTMVCRVGGEQWVPIQEVLPPPSPAVELAPPVPMPPPPPATDVPAAMATPVASQPTPASPKSKKKLIVVISAAIVVVIGGIAALLAVLSACADKAIPDYAKCIELDASGKIREAATACGASILADPNSKAGKAAAEKLKDLQPALDKLAKEDADREAQATVARKEQERSAAAALRARIKRQHTMTDEDDTCVSRGKPPLSYRYTGGTYDQNESVAYSEGCVAYDDRSVAVSGHAQNHFCCPR